MEYRHPFEHPYYGSFYSSGADPVEPPPKPPETAKDGASSPCRFALACGAACVLADAANETREWRAMGIPGPKTAAEMDGQALDVLGKVVAAQLLAGHVTCLECGLLKPDSPFGALVERATEPQQQL